MPNYVTYVSGIKCLLCLRKDTFSALPTLDNNFPCYNDKPRTTRGSGVIGQSVPVESDGPGLLA